MRMRGLVCVSVVISRSINIAVWAPIKEAWEKKPKEKKDVKLNEDKTGGRRHNNQLYIVNRFRSHCRIIAIEGSRMK